MSYDALRDDLRTTYAVTSCLEITPEASRRLPDELKARHPSIEWRNMAAAGNIYRHEYEDVAVREVWDTLSLHLPPSPTVIEQEPAASSDPCIVVHLWFHHRLGRSISPEDVRCFVSKWTFGGNSGWMCS